MNALDLPVLHLGSTALPVATTDVLALRGGQMSKSIRSHSPMCVCTALWTHIDNCSTTTAGTRASTRSVSDMSVHSTGWGPHSSRRGTHTYANYDKARKPSEFRASRLSHEPCIGTLKVLSRRRSSLLSTLLLQPPTIPPMPPRRSFSIPQLSHLKRCKKCNFYIGVPMMCKGKSDEANEGYYYEKVSSRLLVMYRIRHESLCGAVSQQ